MTGPGPTPATFYRPAQVAEMLQCSEWWVKEQARKRRIPYAWIGGSYLFTTDHIAEIVRLFEVRPAVVTAPAPMTGRGSRPGADAEGAQPIRLRARSPRRARVARSDAA
jgi:hypothetical protein